MNPFRHREVDAQSIIDMDDATAGLIEEAVKTDLKNMER